MIVTHPKLPGYELELEAEAGVSLSDGRRWWGSRVRYRKPPAKRWETCVIVDVHPFDVETCVAGLVALLVTKRAHEQAATS